MGELGGGGGLVALNKKLKIRTSQKKDIRIYVNNSRPNGSTEWAEIFSGHSWVAGGCFRLKIDFFSKLYFFVLN